MYSKAIFILYEFRFEYTALSRTHERNETRRWRADKTHGTKTNGCVAAATIRVADFETQNENRDGSDLDIGRRNYVIM